MSSTVEKIIYSDFGNDTEIIDDTVPFEYNPEVDEATPISGEEEEPPPSVSLKSNIAFEQAWGGHQEEPSDPAPSPDPIADLEQQFHRVTRRRKIFHLIMAISCLGTIAIVAVLPERKSQIPSLEESREATTAATSVKSESSKMASAEAIEPTAGVLDRRTNKPESGIVTYAKNQPIKIGIRDYLYLKNTERAYGPAYSYAEKSNLEAALRATPPVLKRIPGEEGRFQPSQGNLQWQGSFEFDDPDRNIELGTAYKEYLESTVGTGKFESLSSLQKGSGRLLSKVERAPGGNGSLKPIE